MEVFQQFLVVLTVLGLLFGALWAMKRKGWARTGLRRKRDDGHTASRSHRSFAAHSAPLPAPGSLADRTLLIGLSPNGCNLLESAQIAMPSALRQES